MDQTQHPHVVVVGGGFAGLTLARALAGKALHVTLIDRENHHLFQPLLYQVATAGLSPGDIASPIRSVFSGKPNVRVLMAEVVDVDHERREVVFADGPGLAYDYLVVAAGAETNYYGNDGWKEHSFGLKSIRDAVQIREHVLTAFETAERETNEDRRRELLTFVVIGGGPTGVEMAGAISELGKHTMKRDFRVVDPTQIRVVLLEMADRVLLPFHPSLSDEARKQLEELGVEVRLGVKVTDVGDHYVEVDGERLPSAMTCWATGVKPVALAAALGAPLERGRVVVEKDCSLTRDPKVFVLGDMAHFAPEAGGRPLPGVAPVAMQQARFVARAIQRDLRGLQREAFQYRDKGFMATVGRSRAVLEAGKIRMAGFVAWLGWLFVHVIYLVGFRNRLVVTLNWCWSYLTFRRGSRLIAQRHSDASLNALHERRSDHPLNRVA